MAWSISELQRSFLLGPGRALIIAGLNIVLVPFIIAHAGIAAVGLWGMINLVTSVFMLGDIGISQYVTRTILEEYMDQDEVREGTETVVSIWVIITLLLTAIAILFAHTLLASQAIAVTGANVAALVLVLLCGGLTLIANLLTFMHIAVHQIHYSQKNDVTVSVVQFLVAIFALQICDAFLALALATFARYAAQCITLYVHLRRLGIAATPLRLRWPDFGTYAKFVVASRGFASLSIFQYLNFVLDRSVALVLGGTTVLGLFEIARRVPFTLEQAFANGFRALFTFFGSADWTSEHGMRDIHDTSRFVYEFIILLGVGSLASWICIAGPTIGLWLNIRNPDLVLATQLFALHNITRSLVIPLFWMAQARRAESIMGIVLASQCVLLTICAAIMAYTHNVSFLDISVLITTLNILGSLAALIAFQIRFHLIDFLIRKADDLLPFIAGAAMIVGAWFLAAPSSGRATATPVLLIHLGWFAVIWAVAFMVMTGGRPVAFLHRLGKPVV